MILQTKKPGYILVYVLLTITMGMAIVSFALSRATVFSAMSHVAIVRAKARQLALGGIVLAMSQLSVTQEKKEQKKQPAKEEGAQDKKENAKEEPQENPDLKFLQKAIVLLNRWQTIKLTEKQDGVQGTIQFYIASEDGKINLNDIYDFEKKKFVGESDKKQETEKPQPPPDPNKPVSPMVEKALAVKEQTADGRKLLDMVCNVIKTRMGSGPSVGDIEVFLKERKRPLDDPTQLLTLPNCAVFKNALFCEPPTKEKTDKRLYFTDLFTVSRSGAPIDPWLFSASMRDVLGLAPVKQGEKKALTEEQLKQLKTQVSWATDWDKLAKPLYEKDYATLSKAVTPFFKNQFAPTTFSIIAYGTVGRVTVHYYAIIERITITEGKEQKIKLMIKQLYQI